MEKVVKHGRGRPGQWWIPRPWKGLKAVWTWHLGTRVSGGLVSAGGMAGFHDLTRFFQLKPFYDSTRISTKTQETTQLLDMFSYVKWPTLKTLLTGMSWVMLPLLTTVFQLLSNLLDASVAGRIGPVMGSAPEAGKGLRYWPPRLEWAMSRMENCRFT